MVQLKNTRKYPCKVGTVVLFSTAGCLLGLGEVAVGLWLLISTKDFYTVLGFVVINLYIGYTCVGGYHAISCAFGICVSILRNKNGLLMFGVLMLASIVCNAGVWVFLFIQRDKVAAALTIRVGEYLLELEEQFPDCNVSSTGSIEPCADAVHSWYWLTVWILLGVTAATIVTAFLLCVTALMLRQLVKEAMKKTRTEIQPLSLRRSGGVDMMDIGVAPSREVHREMWLREPLTLSGSHPGAMGGGASYHGSAPPPQCNCVCHNYEIRDPETKVHRTTLDF